MPKTEKQPSIFASFMRKHAVAIGSMVPSLGLAALWYYTQLLQWKKHGDDFMLTVGNIIVTGLLWLVLMCWIAYCEKTRRKYVAAEKEAVQQRTRYGVTPKIDNILDDFLPPSRPKVYPVRYAGTADRRFGLFLRNDGEAAFDVTIESGIPIGTSRLNFFNQFSVLTKNEGEVLSESNIRTGPGSGMLGSGLMAEMAKFGIEYVPGKITYRDVDDRWYVTDFRLERDVETRGSGIAAKYVGQRSPSSTKLSTTPVTDNTAANKPDVPDVFLEWALPEPDFPGISKDKEIIVVNRSTTDYAYNVQIAPIVLATTLRFAKINEIRPQGRVPISVAAEGLENPEYQPFIRFFMDPDNERIAEERGFIRENKKGVARYSTCLPLTLTYSGKGGPCTAEIFMEFDNWNGARFALMGRK